MRIPFRPSAVPVLACLALFAAAPSPALHFAAYGDARTQPDIHRKVVAGVSRLDPELVLFSGDLWDGYGPDTFQAILRERPNLAALLDKNLYVVSRGNHESPAELLAFKPSLVREGRELYAFAQGDCFFVSVGMNPASPANAAFLEQALQSPEARGARWRIAFSHYPVYSTGAHGAAGIPAVEKTCDRYGVNMFISGHDHIYHRSLQFYGGQKVDTGSSLAADAGTVYLVSGGGGAPLYPCSTATFTRLARSTYNFLDIRSSETELAVKAWTPGDTLIDAFTLRKPATGMRGAAPADAGLRLRFLPAHGLAIASFPPVEARTAVFELRSPDGRVHRRESLSPGQISVSWSTRELGPGEYLAVLQDGDALRTGKFPVRK